MSSDNPILSEASRKKPRRTDHREGSSDYHRVVFEQGDWRVIVCKDRIQWIIQHRICAGSPAGARWIGKHYVGSLRASCGSGQPLRARIPQI